MLSSLLGSKRRRRRQSQSEAGYFNRNAPFRNQVSDARSLQNPFRQRPSDSYQDEDEDAVEVEDEGSVDDEDALDEAAPLLPIFSAAHLDALPLYNVTHSIRLLIIQRCETILTWEQLRSPQISQFLVKPIQQQIQDGHWSRGTIYALIANCLQFNKEAQTNPGSSGFNKTRAMLAEMLAMRLLREFSTRELIDALSYDFDPLQGIPPPPTARGGAPSQKTFNFTEHRPATVRTSTIEVAIRAEAKRFLAHPLVVQHLEAVWRGNIVFHSAADNLHRYPPKPVLDAARHYGATTEGHETLRTRENRITSALLRRAVTIYDPADASVFKLSRLRVPRYRQIFSTLSYMIMLGLFIAVLYEHSLDITALEVIFWFWSAGFMLDELVGFSDQGFGLYIISVWNAFDVGILIMFFIYYVLRLYGIIIAASHKHYIADMAYDVLASTAILLFPRLFNFLDHYKYFSQLLIAFRMMSQDLVAILILMVIMCTGFFVAFALSFGQENKFGGPKGVIYALFQLVMGFTPAAWAVWDEYNVLGQALLVIFMIICHFVVVTILITVLTNSFMAVVKAADEEHQFLFAVNTISMVKSDALFSYIAPTNLIGWLFSPLRYIIPFRQFIKLNRTIIKVTHIPVLGLIYIYEKIRLSRYAEPAELIERPQRRSTLMPFALNGPPDVFSPGTRLREPSITAYHKDRALDEVFRHPFEGDNSLNKPRTETDQQSNVVDKWMTGVGEQGGASPPEEQPRSILERLERNRPPMRRAMTSYAKRKAWRSASQNGSVKSDPDRYVKSVRRRPQPITEEDNEDVVPEPHVTDRDADDELLTNAGDDESVDPSTTGPPHQSVKDSEMHEEDVETPTEAKLKEFPVPSPLRSPKKKSKEDEQSVNEQAAPGPVRRGAHHRNSSNTTILFKPQSERYESSSPSPRRPDPPLRSRTDAHRAQQPAPRRTANINIARAGPSARPGLTNFQSAPNVARFLRAARHDRRAPSFQALALDLASDIGDNRNVVLNDENAPLLGTSFQEQLNREAARRQRRSDEEAAQMSRVMLARMSTLEEGFKDMLREVKMLSSHGGSSRGNSATEAEVSSSQGAARRAARRPPGAGDRNVERRPLARVRSEHAITSGMEHAGDAERRRGSGLRKVETAEHEHDAQDGQSAADQAGAAQAQSVAGTTKSAEHPETAASRPQAKASNSF